MSIVFSVFLSVWIPFSSTFLFFFLKQQTIIIMIIINIITPMIIPIMYSVEISLEDAFLKKTGGNKIV